VDFIQATGFLPQVSTVEKEIYREIYAAEGGNVPDGTTVAGITPGTLRDFKDRISGVNEDTLPKDLTPSQRAQFYRAYLGHALSLVGGWEGFENLNDPGAVRYLADTLFREGRTGGAELIQEAINKALGEGAVARRGPIGPETLGALHRVLENSETRGEFLERLYFLRDDKRRKEWQRNQYFYQRAFE
jgi:lysozyme family protein